MHPARLRCSLSALLLRGFLLLLCLGAGCTEVGTRAPRLESGRWRAAIDIGEGELPFYIEFESSDGGQRGWLLNGEQKTPMLIYGSNSQLVLEFEHHDSRFDAELSTDGLSMSGRWSLTIGDRKVEYPFSATAGDQPLFAAPESNDEAAPLADRWEMQFDDVDSPLIAALHTHGQTIIGNFMHLSGDYPAVLGSYAGGRLQLAHFEGARAYLIEGELQDDGSLVGRLIDPVFLRDHVWSALPNPEAQLPDAFDQIQIADGFNVDALTVYDLDGVAHSFADLHTPGKVLLVEILGTWCPTCHEAAAFLMELHDDYSVHELEVVGLAFEMGSDFTRNVERLRRYRKRHQIGYPIYLASNADPLSPTDLFPTDHGGFSFPTVLFIGADGSIRRSYAGYRSAEHTLEHEQMKTQWRMAIEELLSES